MFPTHRLYLGDPFSILFFHLSEWTERQQHHIDHQIPTLPQRTRFYSSRMSEEPLVILEIPSERLQVFQNTLVCFSNIADYLFFRETDGKFCDLSVCQHMRDIN